MNFELLERKHIITFWLLTLFFIVFEVLMQLYPYFHFYSKSEYTPGEYTLSSFYSEISGKSRKTYSVFVDDSGNTVKVCKTVKDYEGRKTKRYVRDEDDAFREKFELKYINIFDICVVLWIIMISVITVLWLKARKNFY